MLTKIFLFVFLGLLLIEFSEMIKVCARFEKGKSTNAYNSLKVIMLNINRFIGEDLGDGVGTLH